MLVHLFCRLDGNERLLFQTGSPPVPEIGLVEAYVDERRRIPRELLSANSPSARQPIGERLLRKMTARATFRVVAGEPGIENQQLTKRHLFRSRRIICGRRRRLWQ